MLGRLRTRCDCLREGEFLPVKADGDGMAYLRKGEKDALLCAFNRGSIPLKLRLDVEWLEAKPLIGDAPDMGGVLTVPPVSCSALFLQMKPNLSPELSDGK